jgi:leucyl aminopeptidase
VAAVAEAERASAKVPRRDATLANYTIDNGPVVSALIDEVSETHLSSTITSLEGFFTRYHACHSTHHSADWIYSLWEGYAAGRSDVSVEFFNHPGSTTPQPSVILTINAGGEMSLRRPGIVVLGAHQDSYAYPNNCSTSRSPGADDDGSGIAVLSEVIRVALALGYRPHETVQFMAYAAEEVGLRGSDDIAETYAQEGAKVIGVLQLDMTNYKGSVADMYFVTDSTNPAQNTFLGQLVDTYLPSVTRSTDICGYGCSDHASWHSRGYAASFPFESAFNEHNPYIHSANDTLANMGNDVSHTAKFTKLAAAFMAELAKGSLSGPPDATSAGMAGVSLRTESRGAARP